MASPGGEQPFPIGLAGDARAVKQSFLPETTTPDTAFISALALAGRKTEGYCRPLGMALLQRGAASTGRTHLAKAGVEAA
jgi:hypothetical protein